MSHRDAAADGRDALAGWCMRPRMCVRVQAVLLESATAIADRF